MNDAQTSWVVFGSFELDHLVRRLLNEVPQLSASAPDEQGFAQNPDGSYRWMCLDAELGSAAFLFPRSTSFDTNMRETLFALKGGLDVIIATYGNVDDRLWLTLGGAGDRQVIPAQEFLPSAN